MGQEVSICEATKNIAEDNAHSATLAQCPECHEEGGGGGR